MASLEPNTKAHLPHQLESAYSKYHSGTEELISWLIKNTWEAWGFVKEEDNCAFRSGRSNISTHDLIAMSEEISRGNTITVPMRILKLTISVLDGRRRCSDRFGRNATSSIDVESNCSHQHFIRVLEVILANLQLAHDRQIAHLRSEQKPRSYAKPTVEDEQYETDISPIISTISSDDKQVGTNTKEDCSLQTDKASDDHSTRVPRLHDIMSPERDILFRCFCLLEDLNAIRSSIKDSISRYKDGSVPLIVSAIVIEQALEIGRRQVADFAKDNRVSTSYDKIILGFFLKVTCSRRGRVPTSPEDCIEIEPHRLKFSRVGMSDVVDWTFLKAWYHLDRWNREQVSAAAKDTESRMPTTFSSPLKTSAWAGDGTLISQTGSLIREGMMEDIQIFTYDQITDMFCSLVRTDPDTPHSDLKLDHVFIAQVFLDLHGVLSDRGLAMCAIETIVTAKDMKNSQESFTKIVRAIPASSRPVIEGPEMTAMKTRIQNLLSDMYQSHRGRGIQARNPLAAGYTCLYLRLANHSINVEFADSCDNFLAGLHAYTGLMQEHQLDTHWPDMDFVLNTHSPQYFLLGSNPTEHFQRLCRVAGRDREGVMSESGDYRTLQHRAIPLLELFFQLSYSRLKTRDECAEAIRIVLVIIRTYGRLTKHAKLWNAADLSFDMHKLRKLCSREPTTTTSQFLEDLTDALVEEIPELFFDYSILAARCQLLNGIIEEAQSPLDMASARRTGNIWMLRHGGFVRMVRDMQSNERWSHFPLRGAAKEITKDWGQLSESTMKAGIRVLEDFIGESGDEGVRYLKAKLSKVYRHEEIDFETLDSLPLSSRRKERSYEGDKEECLPTKGPLDLMELSATLEQQR